MPSAKKETLLSDVLEQGDYGHFKARLLEESVGQFQRAHQPRRSHVPLALAAALLLAATLVPFLLDRAVEQAAHNVQPATPVIVPAAEPAPLIVETRPLPPAFVVRTVPDRGLTVHTPHTRLHPGMLVTTTMNTPAIDDHELLALFPNRGVGFVEIDGDRRLFVSTPRENTEAPN